jgi:hypothetical protein
MPSMNIFSPFLIQVYKPTMARFADLGGSTKGSPEEVAKGDLQNFSILANNFISYWLDIVAMTGSAVLM